MPTKSPAVWSDFLTAIGQITAILILVCALAGPAQQYSKGEKMFYFLPRSLPQWWPASLSIYS